MGRRLCEQGHLDDRPAERPDPARMSESLGKVGGTIAGATRTHDQDHRCQPWVHTQTATTRIATLARETRQRSRHEPGGRLLVVTQRCHCGGDVSRVGGVGGVGGVERHAGGEVAEALPDGGGCLGWRAGHGERG